MMHGQKNIKNTMNVSWEVKTAIAYGWRYHFQVPIVVKSARLMLLEPSGTVQASTGIVLALHIQFVPRSKHFRTWL